mgnify:CR=1 FL=1
MRINHNISALNAYRQLSVNNNSLQKSLEKLSSGFRINRAGDDAAGLAISEKMRGQIRGLEQASRNAQDAISLIQTAEGALNETHAILQRIRELAVQASNDTNVEADRNAINDEIQQLISEIDRISTTTEFNTQKLLNGTFKGVFQIGANESQSLSLSINKMNSAALGLASSIEVETATVNVGGLLKDGVYTVSSDGTKLLDASGKVVGAVSGTNITLADDSTTISFTNEDVTAGAIIRISENGNRATMDKVVASGETNDILAAGTYTVVNESETLNVYKDGEKIGTASGTTITLDDGTSIDLATVFKKTADLANGYTFVVKGVNVSTSTLASGTITAIDKAIESVSTERSKLGALQNRLEHTINNLGTAAENLTAAESRIRDVDMAKEMMEFTKMSILQQAATAMLAQANQLPQAVLQLLR